MNIITITQNASAGKYPAAQLIKSVKLFLGIQIKTIYTRSRIIRRPTKTYEEFIFKGYDQHQPDIFNPRSFKNIKMIVKN